MVNRVDILEAVKITSNRVKLFDDKKRYLATGNLSNQGIDNFLFVDYENKPSRADLMVSEGDLILARMKATNKVFLIDCDSENLIVSTGFLTLKPKDGFDGRYLYHYFRSKTFQRLKDKYCSGATQMAISNSSFKNLKVPHYKIAQQKKIVQILDTASNLRQKRKEQLASLDDYLKSVFIEMFASYLNIQSEFIYLEKLTKKITVGHVGPTSFAYIDRGIPFLRTQNIKRNFIDLNQLAYIGEEFHRKLKKSQIHTNDVLISRVGVNRGMAAVVPKELDSANCANVVIVGKSEGFNSIFLSAYLNFTYGRSAKFGYSVGSAQGVVNTSIIKKWPIIDVNIEIENKFASIVEQVENTKQKMRASLEEMDTHFNALMQRYFE
ncbi:MAG TPA: restriction endonuclease subunit S [Candidatus Atribacteria bacterium]|nr:restriction endonuclease subunit S [Candidatus Atribacteria bacterium]